MLERFYIDMDIVTGSEDVREDTGFITKDHINLNTFFTYGPHLNREEIEQKKVFRNKNIGIDNQEDHQFACVPNTLNPQV